MAGYAGIPLVQMTYDTKEYDLRSPVQEILCCRDLPNLHKRLGEFALFTRETDQLTEVHQTFYNNMFGRFGDSYRHFIEGVVRPMFEEPVVYQRFPTFRAHLPGNVAVGEWHKDTDYNHNPEAITYWVPLTDAYGSNSIHVEQNGEERAIYVKYGRVLIFDSMNLRHGNAVNGTGKTRVSLDFRVIPESKFEPSDRMSLNTGLTMDVGSYYERAA